MIRAFFVEIVFPLLVFFLIRSVFRGLFQSFRGSSPPTRYAPPREPAVSAGGELKKDPVCGTYVYTAASVTSTVHGQVMHFCSKECRDKYRVA